MRILLTNDDGPFGEGLCALRRALKDLGEVTVVCPAEERSGVGHAITFLVPLHTERVTLHDGGPATIVSGFPTDCVKFAMLEVLERPPDLLVSGINPGLNVGVDVFYSGTVAAALEGAFHGVTSVAISTDRENAGQMPRVAQEAVRLLRSLPLHDGLSAINVNIPLLTDKRPEWRVTRQSDLFPVARMVPAGGPRERQHFYLDFGSEPEPPPPDTDVGAVQEGVISITPLLTNLTDRAAVPGLAASMDDAVAEVDER